MVSKPKLIVIVGPTASGKTNLAVEVAEALQTEIISADSRQIYAEMNIGVAKPHAEELLRVVHHFIGNVSIHEPYSAGIYGEQASSLIKELFRSHPALVMVGGSGLYINAVLEGMDPLPSDIDVRRLLNAMYESEGIAYLQQKLKALDPVYFSKVDIQNPHRLIRAIEVSQIAGRPYSELITGAKRELPFDIIKVGLTGQREFLYDRINRRVEQMIEAGLIEEAKELIAYQAYPSLQTVGYKELFEAIEGKIKMVDAIEKIKQHTRQYAKRQLTWWRRDPEVQWAAIDQGGRLLSFVKGVVGF
jgi:tRNA dimethylallyltransferase